MSDYERWFVEVNGPRPDLPRGTEERIAQLRAELEVIERMKEERSDWDRRYMAGVEALRKFTIGSVL